MPNHAPSGRIRFGDFFGNGSLLIKYSEASLFSMRANGVLLTLAVRKLFKIVLLEAGLGERAKAFLASLSICGCES